MKVVFKKIISAVLIAAMLISLFGCENEQGGAAQSGEEDIVESGKEKFDAVSYDYFDTVSMVVGYEESKEKFSEYSDFALSELERYNMLYDIYHTYAGVNNLCTLNRDAGKAPVEVDDDIIALLDFAIEMYDLTEEMTNVAMGSVLSIWHRYRDDGNYDPSKAEVPPMEKLKAAAEHCDINDIIIDRENKTVFYADPELKIDVGAIAKGYATERIAKDLEAMGAENYTLNIGGNIRTLGPKADQSKWSAGIQNPDMASDKKFLLKVLLENVSLVTSGTYQRYYYVDGVKYHHIIRPDTLMPENEFDSVSIICPDSGVADALSTACFNLPLSDGLELIESLENTEAMWVKQSGEEYFSKGFLNYKLEE